MFCVHPRLNSISILFDRKRIEIPQIKNRTQTSAPHELFETKVRTASGNRQIQIISSSAARYNKHKRAYVSAPFDGECCLRPGRPSEHTSILPLVFLENFADFRCFIFHSLPHEIIWCVFVRAKVWISSSFSHNIYLCISETILWPAFVAENIPNNIGDHSDVSETVTSTTAIRRTNRFWHRQTMPIWIYRILWNVKSSHHKCTAWISTLHSNSVQHVKWNEHNGQWSMIINNIYIFRKWHIRFGFVVIFRSWHTHTLHSSQVLELKRRSTKHTQIDVRIRITMVELGRRNENKNHFNNSHINSCIWFWDALPFCRSLCLSILSIAISKLYSSSITVKFTMKNSNELHRKCKQINRTFHEAKCSSPFRGPSSHSHLVWAWGSEETLQCLPNWWRTHTWLSTQWIACDQWSCRVLFPDSGHLAFVFNHLSVVSNQTIEFC